MAKESSKVLLIDGREVRDHEPRELVQYDLSVVAGALAGVQDHPIILKRFVQRRRGGGILSKARIPEAASLVAYGHFVVQQLRANSQTRKYGTDIVDSLFSSATLRRKKSGREQCPEMSSVIHSLYLGEIKTCMQDSFLTEDRYHFDISGRA